MIVLLQILFMFLNFCFNCNKLTSNAAKYPIINSVFNLSYFINKKYKFLNNLTFYLISFNCFSNLIVITHYHYMIIKFFII